MPSYPQVAHLTQQISQFLPYDQNRPYRVRRAKAGARDEHGEIVGDQWEYRTINNMITQPLGDNDFNRLPEGMRDRSWRFIGVLPETIGQLPASKDDEFIRFYDQVEYDGNWWEIKFLNDWDLVQSAKAVFVE